MNSDRRIRRICDDILEIKEISPRLGYALSQAIAATNLAQEVVPAHDRIGIQVGLGEIDELESLLPSILESLRSETVPTRSPILVPVRYGGASGPDLQMVAERLGLTKREFIRLHTDVVHRVRMTGFIPGFAYIEGLPDFSDVPRLTNPRPNIAAGSVGVSGALTGIYALPGPGGWPLVGRTDARLVDHESKEPFELSLDREVRFVEAG